MVTLDASTIVFEEFTRVLHAVIGINPGKNLKLKRLAVYSLLPTLVNLSKSFMRSNHSARFMILLHAAMQVQWGVAKEVKNNVTQLLDLHM